jgi:ribosomal protein L14E/L6E/L27E
MTHATIPPCTVYALVASDEPDEIRYIGQTTHLLRQRLAKHLWDARHKLTDNKPLSQWMRSVEGRGAKVLILSLVENAVLHVTEVEQIAEHRAKGCNLTNVAAGGEGVSLLGEKRPESVSKKLWETRIANGKALHSEETKAKMRESHAKREFSDEFRKAAAERLRELRKGKKFGPPSDEARLKISLALKGKPKSPEHIAAAAAARKSVGYAKEATEKFKEAQRKRWLHIDWAGIENSVRNTTKSYCAIALEFGISPEGVRKRSIKSGWRVSKSSISSADSEVVSIEVPSDTKGLLE